MNNLIIGAVRMKTSTVRMKTITLKIDDPVKLSVVSLLSTKPTVNSKTSEVTFKVNEVGPKKSWRLVHDGKRVVTLFESDGYTTSAYQIFEAKTEEGCLKEVARIHLAYEPEVI